jgi:hypothetical protein
MNWQNYSTRKARLKLIDIIASAIGRGACMLEEIKGQDAVNLLIKYNELENVQDETLDGVCRLLNDKAFNHCLSLDMRAKLAELLISHEKYQDDLNSIFEMVYADYEYWLEYIAETKIDNEVH